MAASPREIRDALEASRRAAVDAQTGMGRDRLAKLLEKANASLANRLKEAQARGLDSKTFTQAQMRATMRHVEEVTRRLQLGVGEVVVDNAVEAAGDSSQHVVDYLRSADEAFRGVGVMPLQLREAAIYDVAVSGANASALRRLVSGPEDAPDARRHGILERYGMQTVGHFEEVLQEGLLTRKPWGEVRDDLIAQSAFLQEAPAYWAERIVRTETAHAYSRAGWEGMKEADDQLGNDLVRILSATFDDRTGADSVATHGMVRGMDEPFDSWFGEFMHPPDRPNDRGVVVPHRLSWPFPAYLRPRSDAEVMEHWRREGRKGAHPPRPRMGLELLGGGGGEEGGKSSG